MTAASGIARAALAPAALLAAWEGIGHLPAMTFLVAPPSAVVLYLIENAGLMVRALVATGQAALAGFVLGNLAALALAVAAMMLPRSERVIAGLALVVFCLPLVATGPILRVLFGAGMGPQITLAALAVYYTTFVPVLVGLRAAPSVWFDLVQSYGRGRLSALWAIRLPAALPYVFTGLQIAAPAAFLGAMVGEFTGAERGVGVLTIRAMRALDVEATWALAVVSAGVAMLAYAGVGALGRALAFGPPPLILAAPTGGRTARAPGVVIAVVVGGIALAAWWAAMEWSGLNPFFAKRPDDLWAAFVTGPNAAALRAPLIAGLAETAAALIPGYVAGMAAGAALAIAVTLAPGLASLAMPVAVTLRSVPIVTTAPLIVLALGRGSLGAITLVAVMVFFPAFVACLYGLARAPAGVLQVFATYGAGRVPALLHAQIPAMLPAFFAAARMAVPAAVLAVTVVEWLATGQGLGSLMAISASVSDYTTLWAAVVLVTVLSAAGYAAIAWIEAQVLARFAPEQGRA